MGVLIMKVAFSVGEKSEKLIKILNSMADNIEFFTYSSVRNLIKESTLRHLYFDRIVFSEKALGGDSVEEAISDLNDYITRSSDMTNVVLLVNKESPETSDIFLKYFNSQMYTPALLGKVTPNILLDIVTDDIINVRTKYFTLDDRKANSVVSESSKDNKKSNKGSGKKGFFGRLFGKKNTPEEGNLANKESVGKTEDSKNAESEDVINRREGGTKFSEDNDIFSSNNRSNTSSSEKTKSNNFDEDQQDLNLGSYGTKHTDTGYLDEEEIDSIKVDDVEEDVNDESQVEEQIQDDIDWDSSKSSISILTGDRNTESTGIIVDEAIHISEDDKRVLIVDCDEYSPILSYIDTEKYYATMRSGSYLYSEDGIDILSGGYGNRVSCSDVISIITRGNYDKVFIDCPLMNLSIYSGLLSTNVELVLVCKGDKSSLIRTSLLIDEIGDADVKERLVDSKVVIVKRNNYFDEDLKFVKNSVLLLDCDWLSSVEE